MPSRDLFLFFWNCPNDPRLSTADWIGAILFCYVGLAVVSPVLLVLFIIDMFRFHDAVTGIEQTKAATEYQAEWTRYTQAVADAQRVELQREQQNRDEANRSAQADQVVEDERLRPQREAEAKQIAFDAVVAEYNAAVLAAENIADEQMRLEVIGEAEIRMRMKLDKLL